MNKRDIKVNMLVRIKPEVNLASAGGGLGFTSYVVDFIENAKRIGCVQRVDKESESKMTNIACSYV